MIDGLAEAATGVFIFGLSPEIRGASFGTSGTG